jgi:threonine/homoserine/homoserine lactone efflux protein
MMSLSQFLAFALLSAAIIAVPGPSVLFTVGRALSVGRREALLTVVGNATGAYLQAIAVAVGVGVIVERSPGPPTWSTSACRRSVSAAR